MNTQLSLRRELYQRAILESFWKLDPRRMVRNPVMFVVEIGSLLTTLLWLQTLLNPTANSSESAGFVAAIAFWLWFTVLFANFSEALAEGRGKAQAEALRRTRQETVAKKLSEPHRQAAITVVPSTLLRQNDLLFVETGDIIPADGEIIQGVASVDESAVTGESAPRHS